MAKSSNGKATAISDEAVMSRTGKSWEQWFTILDEAGFAGKAHREIARHIHHELKISDWWSQMITVAYEQARGKRVKHQKADGFSISRSRTLPVPVADLYAAWIDEARRKKWLKAPDLVVRTATPRKSMRITWSDGKSSVEALFSAKGRGKSRVTVQHNKLGSARAAARMKQWWSKRLDRLRSAVAAKA